jgi:biotin carboxyl carrier protein
MENQKYKITVNETDFFFSGSEVFDSDVTNIEGNNFHFLLENKSYNAQIVTADFSNKNYSIEIEGEVFEVNIKGEIDQKIEKLGFENNSTLKVSHIKAPMPGLVLDILVSEGQNINKGELLIILEAMKMENSIKMPIEGTINKILVQKGQAVEKGQNLMELK